MASCTIELNPRLQLQLTTSEACLLQDLLLKQEHLNPELREVCNALTASLDSLPELRIPF